MRIICAKRCINVEVKQYERIRMKIQNWNNLKIKKVRFLTYIVGSYCDLFRKCRDLKSIIGSFKSIVGSFLNGNLTWRAQQKCMFIYILRNCHDNIRVILIHPDIPLFLSFSSYKHTPYNTSSIHGDGVTISWTLESRMCPETRGNQNKYIKIYKLRR